MKNLPAITPQKNAYRIHQPGGKGRSMAGHVLEKGCDLDNSKAPFNQKSIVSFDIGKTALW